MKILIAEDDNASRQLLSLILANENYQVVEAIDGAEALDYIRKDSEIRLAILDWLMPEYDGPQICKILRSEKRFDGIYLILLTVQSGKENILEGLNAGADDYLTKPCDREVLLARVNVGKRLISLRQELADRIAALEKALDQVKKLHGLLPICSYCKKIRNDSNYWQQLEEYISSHSGAEFSHGICPDCFKKYFPSELE